MWPVAGCPVTTGVRGAKHVEIGDKLKAQATEARDHISINFTI